MKKIASILSLFILFSTICIAQDKISRENFEHLVDYANCQYLMEFIEKHDKGKPYIKDIYERRVKPILQKASLDDLNSTPTFEVIKGLFPGNTNDPALKLAEEINKKKLDYGKASDNAALLNLLKADSWIDINLKGTATKICDDVSKKYNFVQDVSNNTTNVDSVKLKDKEFDVKSQYLQQKVEALEGQIRELRSEKTKFWVILIILIIAVSATTAILIKRKIKQEIESVKSDVLDIRRSNRRPPKEDNRVIPNIKSIEEKITLIEQQMAQLQSKDTNEEKHSKNNDDEFFMSKEEGKLIGKTSNLQDAYFRVFDVAGNSAQFEYCGKVVNQDFFSNVCGFANNPSDIPNINKIITTTPGTVKKDSNGNWEVVEKAKIKFE